MKEEIKINKVGKLRIYLKTGEVMKSEGWLRRMFPKSKYHQIMQEAKEAGILNAHVYHTKAAVHKGGKLTHDSVEGDGSGLTVCVELVDTRAVLEQFFRTHKDLIRDSTTIFKEVEFWEFAD